MTRLSLSIAAQVAMIAPVMADPVITPIVTALAATAFTVGTVAVTVGQVVTFVIWAGLVALQVFQHTQKRGSLSPMAIAFGSAEDSQRRAPTEIGLANVILGAARVHGYPMQYVGRDGVLYFVQTISAERIDGLDEVWFGDRQIPLDANGYVTAKPYSLAPPLGWSSNLRIEHRTGEASQVAFAPFVSALAADGATAAAWDSTSRGDGIADLYIRATATGSAAWRTAFPNDIERITVVARGRPRTLWDPRDGSTAYTQNGTLLLMAWLRSEYGFNLPLDRFDLWTWRRRADIDDQIVFDVDGQPRKRWTINVDVRGDQGELVDRLSMLRQAGDYWLVDGPHGLAVWGGAWEEPTIEIGEADVIAITQTARGTPRVAAANIFKIFITWAANEHRVTGSASWRDEASIALIGPREATLNLEPVDSIDQGRRVAKINAAMANPARRLGLRLTNWCAKRLRAQIDDDGKARPARMVRVTIPSRGIDGTFRVMAGPTFDGERRTHEVELISLGPEAYAFDAATETGAIPSLRVDTRQGGGLPLPGITVTSAGTTATITATAPGRSDLVLEAQHRANGSPVWPGTWTAGTVGGLTVTIAGLPTGSRDFRARWTEPVEGLLGPATQPVTRTI